MLVLLILAQSMSMNELPFIIYDEGSRVSAVRASTINCSGTGITCTQDAGVVTIAAAASAVLAGQITDDSLPGATTTSATLVDLFTGSYTQQKAGGYVLVLISGSIYSTATNTEAAVSVTYDGVAASTEHRVFMNPLTTHTAYSAIFKVAASATTGAKAVAIRWRRVSGSGTLTTNSGDSAFITVMEVN